MSISPFVGIKEASPEFRVGFLPGRNVFLPYHG